MRLLSVYALQRLTSAAPFKAQGRRQTLENAASSTSDTQWRLAAAVWSLRVGKFSQSGAWNLDFANMLPLLLFPWLALLFYQFVIPVSVLN